MATRSIASRSAEIAVRSVADFMANKSNIAAAGITYFALISIFPLVLVALSAAGFVYSSEADQQRLLDEIVAALPLEEGGARDEVAEIVSSTVESRGRLGVFGILTALYTGSALFTAVRVGLNRVFRGEKSRPFVVGKLVDVGMVVVFGILLTLSTGASFALAFVGKFADQLVGSNRATELGMAVASIAVAVLIAFALFLLLYTKVPATNIGAKHAIPGALVAALLFEALTTGFALYAANFGNYNATYGSLGFIVLLLVFIYFTGQVMLLGAEIGQATDEVSKQWPLAPEDSRAHALRLKIVGIVGKAERFVLRRPSPDPAPTHTAVPRAAIAEGLPTVAEQRLAASSGSTAAPPEVTASTRTAVIVSLVGALAATLALARARLK